MSNTIAATITNDELDQFIDYCCSFYDKNGKDPVYPIAFKEEIEVAVSKYIVECDGDEDWPTWGGGDSMDREGVRRHIESQWSDEPKFSERDIKNFFDRVNGYIKRGEVTHLTYEDFVREPVLMKPFRPDSYQHNDTAQAEADEKLASLVASLKH
jgi:hypothetical protein